MEREGGREGGRECKGGEGGEEEREGGREGEGEKPRNGVLFILRHTAHVLTTITCPQNVSVQYIYGASEKHMARVASPNTT